MVVCFQLDPDPLRYILFFFGFKLWRLISQERLAAFAVMAASIVLTRSQEFLYRTFSHQEFAIAIVFAGIYFFYRERFLLAATLLGIAANFNALYSIYPMFYFTVYLIWQHKKHGWKILLQSIGLYLLVALPFIVWNVQKFIAHQGIPQPGPQEWIPLFMLACPQNFLFKEIPLDLILKDYKVALLALRPYLALVSLYLLNQVFHPKFRQDRKIQAIAFSVTVLLVLSFVFSYIRPIRFVVDLNMVRNTQFLFYFLMGYTGLWVIRTCRQEQSFWGLLTVSAYSLLYLDDIIKLLSIGFLIFLTATIRTGKAGMRPSSLVAALMWGALAVACAAGIWKMSRLLNYDFKVIDQWAYVTGILLLLSLTTLLRLRWAHFPELKNYFILIPIAAMFCSFISLHSHYLKSVKNNEGFWALQNSWEDMQRYVRDHTPKNAYILAPNDMEMGGFRILSERKILVCYRDCGIIGFDYQAAKEWQRRLKDVEAFKVLLDKNQDLGAALLKAVQSYKVNYVVFMRYYAPPAGVLGFAKIYENDHFSLFEVKMNPVPQADGP